MKDCIVIGSGIAGMTAALYVARAGFKPVIVSSCLIQDSTSSIPFVNNYPGFKGTGQELSRAVSEQCLSSGVEFMEAEVSECRLDRLEVMADGERMQALSIVIASGCSPRRPFDGCDALLGNGFSYCAVCDGPLAEGMGAVVIGGGDSAFSEALHLSKLCSEVTILHRSQPRASRCLVDAVSAKDNIVLRRGAPISISGETGKVVLGLDDGSEISCGFVFSAVGGVPNTSFVEPKSALLDGLVRTDGPSVPGFHGCFAAGDCCDGVRQLAAAAGSGCRAGLAVANLLSGR